MEKFTETKFEILQLTEPIASVHISEEQKYLVIINLTLFCCLGIFLTQVWCVSLPVWISLQEETQQLGAR